MAVVVMKDTWMRRMATPTQTQNMHACVVDAVSGHGHTTMSKIGRGKTYACMRWMMVMVMARHT
eukprot:1453746-Lingulodinium_polyedra.AAC.1